MVALLIERILTTEGEPSFLEVEKAPMRQRWVYALATMVILGIEILIALYVHDNFIRPFVGDVLVVVLIYCFMQTLVLANPKPVVAGVVCFACLIEILQYFDFVAVLGLADSRLASVVLGRTFAWEDFAAYLTGGLLTLAFEGQKGTPNAEQRNST